MLIFVSFKGALQTMLLLRVAPSISSLKFVLFLFQAELEMERDQLLIERGRQERLASSITDQMNLDAQVGFFLERYAFLRK